MARSSRKVSRMPRTIVISHRGGGATGSGSDVTVECYVASAFGGPADLQLLVMAGSVTAVTAKPNRAWDHFVYAAGDFTNGTGGYRWNGGWAVVPPYLRVVATETFEAYGEGTLAGSAGSGWSGGWAAGIPYLRLMAVDTFEAYDEGAMAGNGGSGWNGGFVVASY